MKIIAAQNNLPPHPAHTITPRKSHSRRDHTEYKSHDHKFDELGVCFPGVEFIRVVENCCVIEIRKISHSENSVARTGRHQEICEWPLRREERQHKQGSRYQRQFPSSPLASLKPHKIQSDC